MTPPSRLKPHAAVAQAAPKVPTLVVAKDDAAWRAIIALQGVTEPRQFDSVAELLADWTGRRAAVVVVDTRGLHDAATQLNALLLHGAALVPVGLVDEDLRAAAAALERQHLLFDHLLVPLDPGTARSILARAAEEAAARLALTAGDTGVAPAAPVPAPPVRAASVMPVAAEVVASTPAERVAKAPAESPPPVRNVAPSRRFTLLAAVCIVLLGGLPVAWLLRSPGTPSPVHVGRVPAAPAALVPPTGVAGTARALASRSLSDEQVEASLDLARLAMRERRYIDPPEDSALHHYQNVLALEPTNGEARQGLQRVTELLLTRAATALAAHDNAGALRALEAARALQPADPRLAGLDAQVASRASELWAPQLQAAMQAGAFYRATVLLAQAEKGGAITAAAAESLRAEIARRSAAAQLEDLVRLAQARIAQGQLLEPAGDNARQYLATLQQRAGPALADELERLSTLYQKRLAGLVREAMEVGAWTQADAWLAALRATRGAGATAAALQRELEQARAAPRSIAPLQLEPPPPVVELAAPPPAPGHLDRPAPSAAPPQAALQTVSGRVRAEPGAASHDRLAVVARLLGAQSGGRS